MTELSFGQRIDPTNGLIQPWFTHGALDAIAAMDLREKNILQFGAGMGDIWLAQRCKSLTTIERKPEWLNRCVSERDRAGMMTKMGYIHRECNDCDGHAEFYTNIPGRQPFDIIINDDAYRTEVCEAAVKYFTQGVGGILICDNWDQDYVWISPKAQEIMAPYNGKFYVQQDHTNHEGKPWQTAIFFIPPAFKISLNQTEDLTGLLT